MLDSGGNRPGKTYSKVSGCCKTRELLMKEILNKLILHMITRTG